MSRPPDISLFVAVAGVIPLLLLALVVGPNSLGPSKETWKQAAILVGAIAGGLAEAVCMLVLMDPTDKTRQMASVAVAGATIVAGTLVTSVKVPGGKGLETIAKVAASLLALAAVAALWYAAAVIAA